MSYAFAPMPESNAVPVQRFALLGATGNTGRLILQTLLQEKRFPEIRIHVYVRSQAKLEALFPSLLPDDRVVIFAGSLDDEDLIRNCLSGVTTIFCTVGENENIPGVHVLQDCARAVLGALTSIQNQAPSNWVQPRLLLLSSATWNPVLSAPRPALLHWMIRNAFARPYRDLVNAQEMFLSAPSLVSVLLVQPNALVKEEATGCIISSEHAHMAVSYADLAEGFVQLATIPQYRDARAVGVSSKRAENPLLYMPFVLGKVFRGLLFQFVPGYWQTEYAIFRFFARSGGKAKIQ